MLKSNATSAVKAQKSIVRVVYLPSVVQSEFYSLFCMQRKKINDSTIRLLSVSPLHRSAILEIIHWTQNAYTLLYQSQYKDTYSTCIYALIWTKIAHTCIEADGRWTILVMLFILFCALTVLFIWQSMGQSQTSRFHLKYLKLCSVDERSFYGFGTTWG